VRVTGLGRCGLMLAGLVAAAGVGTLELDDESPVTQHEIGPGGLSARDLGVPRSTAAARMLHDVAPGVRTAAPGTSAAPAAAGPVGRRPHHPDLVVLVEHGAAEPIRYRRLTDDGVAHLSIVLREASVLIGPLVTPRRSACLWCVDLHRADLVLGDRGLVVELESADARRRHQAGQHQAAAAQPGDPHRGPTPPGEHG
jgi:hypothetical protein